MAVGRKQRQTDRKQFEAARTIQAQQQKREAMRVYSDQKSAIVTIQSGFRGKQARNERRRLIKAMQPPPKKQPTSKSAQMKRLKEAKLQKRMEEKRMGP